jgi:hypothetical protein
MLSQEREKLLLEGHPAVVLYLRGDVIKSDPNREDDPQYIVRLVGQVVRVSMETVRIVRSLPPVFPG